MGFNKKGFTGNLFLPFLIIIAVLFAMILGIGVIFFQQIDSAMNQNISLGQVNMATVHNQTLGQLTNAFVTRADEIGIIILLGMFSSMIVAAHLLKRESKLFIAVDIFLIIVSYIISVYIAQTYNTFINSSSLFNVYINNIPNTSRFILNLPFITGSVGVLIMIFSYINIRKGRIEQGPIVGGIA